MLEIRTYVDIDASAALVWGILTDFRSYKRWNPFIRAVLGQAQVGNSIEVTQDVAAIGGPTFRSTVTHVREPRELRWLGGWAVPGLYSAEHRFGIESRPDGRVRLHHGGKYRGVIVPFLQRRLQSTMQPAFDAMNVALKRRAERAEEPNAPITVAPASSAADSRYTPR